MQWYDKRKTFDNNSGSHLCTTTKCFKELFFTTVYYNLLSLHRVLSIINHSRISRIRITREFVFLIMSFNFKINITDSFKYLHILNVDGYNGCLHVEIAKCYKEKPLIKSIHWSTTSKKFTITAAVQQVSQFFFIMHSFSSLLHCCAVLCFSSNKNPIKRLIEIDKPALLFTSKA